MSSQVHVKNLEMLASLALVFCSLIARLERPNGSRGRLQDNGTYFLRVVKEYNFILPLILKTGYIKVWSLDSE